MASITSTEDLLRLLREDATFREAARRELLSEDLLRLPEVVAQLARELHELRDLVERFVESTNRRLGALESDVDTLKSDVATLKSDVGTLKFDVGTLKGRQVEDTYRRSAPTRFRRVDGGLRRMDVLDAARLAELADDAHAARRITAREADQLTRADLVAFARRAAGEQVVVVAEISATIHHDDVEHALARARVASKATGLPAVVVVAGDEVPPLPLPPEPIWVVKGHDASLLAAAGQ